jgi:UDP-N-acetylmuramoylalanine--D-glutamate ligase
MRASLSAQVYYTLENGFIKRNGERLIREEEIGIEGIYARQNLLGALALTDGYATPDGQREVARSFTALPHRCTVTVSPSGRRFIDSSIDTTPSRTAATLRSLDRRVGIILGGRGKGLSPEPLVEPLAQFAEVIGIYGEWGEELYGYLRPRLKGAVIERVDRMAEAVDIAVAGCSSDVLLSPAATSYGEFTDYRQRGEFFTEYVKKYYFT